MKLTHLSTALLLAPAASHALQLPFKLDGLKATLDSYYTQLSSAAASRFQAISDPISASPLLSLHRSLCEIPSVTGNESAVGAWLAGYLTSKNFTVETQTVGEDGRVNVFAYLGTNRTTHTLLTSHIDTVPPFIDYKVSGNAIYGRGTNDAKGSVAAQIIAAEELVAEGKLKEGDLSLLYVVGEEVLGDGMIAANKLPGKGWKAVIFGEPTENKLAVGHKGIIMLDVVAQGKASHSGYPQLGINANSHLIQALAILDNLKMPTSELMGNSTLNIGHMSGGVASNVIPASASASLLIRVAGDLAETLKVIKNSVAHLPVEIVWSSVQYGPVATDFDVEGFETAVMSYGTDVPHLYGDHKKYLYGPGSILTAHGDGEFVLKSDLIEAVSGYKTLVKESLWPSKRVPAVVPVVDTASSELPPVSSSAIVIETPSSESSVESVVVETVPEKVVATESGSNNSGEL